MLTLLQCIAPQSVESMATGASGELRHYAFHGHIEEFGTDATWKNDVIVVSSL